MTHYDPEADVLAINWGNGSITDSDEVEPGVIIDYDLEGNVVGVEILNASVNIKNVDGGLMIQPQTRKKYTLDELLEEMTPDNFHPEINRTLAWIHFESIAQPQQAITRWVNQLSPEQVKSLTQWDWIVDALCVAEI